MPTCSAGHESASTDFCDVCGMRLDGHRPARPARVCLAGRSRRRPARPVCLAVAGGLRPAAASRPARVCLAVAGVAPPPGFSPASPPPGVRRRPGLPRRRPGRPRVAPRAAVPALAG